MAVLHRLVAIGGDGPGFLLPIFRSRRGANQDLIQKIGHDELILAFEEVACDEPAVLGGEKPIELESGDPAIWAFRDSDHVVRVGTSDGLRPFLLEYLDADALSGFPAIAAEVAAFCNAEGKYPNVLIEGFRALSKLSVRGAETWRDAVVILPHIKREMAQQIGPRSTARKQIKEVVAIVRGHTLHVFASDQFRDKVKKGLPETHQIAAIFGVQSYQIHWLGEQKAAPAPQSYSCCILGVGGIARFVLTKAPFFGSPASARFLHDGTIAYLPTAEAAKEPFLIGIVPTSYQSASEISASIRLLRGEPRHAINIRPIGFGTPRRDKPSPLEMQEMLSAFRSVWMLTSHRQRQTGNFANGLSASNTASRVSKAVVLALIEISRRRGIDRILRERWGGENIKLCSAIGFDASIPLDLVLKRALYALLCEEGALDTAERIVVLLPYLNGVSSEDSEGLHTVSLGRKRYEVSLFRAITPSKGREVVALATGVKASIENEREFYEFCWSLFAGYNWKIVQIDRLAFEIEAPDLELPIRVRCAASSTSMMIALDQSEYFEGKANRVVVTNQTVPKSFRKSALRKGISVLHYSEIDRMVRGVYDRSLLAGAEPPKRSNRYRAW